MKYFISGILKENNKISKYFVQTVNESGVVLSSAWMVEEQIVDLKEHGLEVATITWDYLKKEWVMGAEVTVTSAKHLRTAQNDSPEDNLGNLLDYTNMKF